MGTWRTFILPVTALVMRSSICLVLWSLKWAIAQGALAPLRSPPRTS
ncbi:hypothetical protein [Scytonema sp. PCC 10023]